MARSVVLHAGGRAINQAARLVDGFMTARTVELEPMTHPDPIQALAEQIADALEVKAAAVVGGTAVNVIARVLAASSLGQLTQAPSGDLREKIKAWLMDAGPDVQRPEDIRKELVRREVNAVKLFHEVEAEVSTLTARLAELKQDMACLVHEHAKERQSHTFMVERQAADEAEVERLTEALTASQADLAALQAERDRLREALLKFGRHNARCSVVGGYTYDCDCGLAVALVASPTHPQEPTP